MPALLLVQGDLVREELTTNSSPVGWGFDVVQQTNKLKAECVRRERSGTMTGRAE
jgi:hypothetical protein